MIAIHGVSEFNSLPYLIMPYIKGQSLQKRIDQHGLLSTTEILRIAMQMAKGLSVAHDQGLVSTRPQIIAHINFRSVCKATAIRRLLCAKTYKRLLTSRHQASQYSATGKR